MYVKNLVSVIITTHNRRELLVKAIESVLNQTYSNIECIIVDDASTDGTEQYISQYTHNKNIKYQYIPPEQSKGGNHARNVGLELATGEVIAFLDDDDEWLPTKVEKQISKLTPNSQFVYCGRCFEYDNNPSDTSEELIEDAKFKEGDLANEVLVHFIGVTSTIMVYHSLIDEVGKFDEMLKAWQEYDLSIRLLQRTNAALVRENLVLYRVQRNDKNRNTNNISKWIDSVKIIETKYKTLFSSLNGRDKSRRKLYKCIDGFNRACNANNIWQKAKFLFLLLTDPRVIWIMIMKKRRPELGL